MRGAFIGVGVGPGDPDLLTVRALRALGDADRVFSPTMAVDAVGRAESIVRQADPAIRVERHPEPLIVEALRGGPCVRCGLEILPRSFNRVFE